MDELRDCPIWWNGKDVVEAAFCEKFMDSHQLTYDGNAFFTLEGRMTDVLSLFSLNIRGYSASLLGVTGRKSSCTPSLRSKHMVFASATQKPRTL